MPEIAFLFDPPEPLKVACSMQCALQSLQTAAHCCRGHEARTETGPHREQYFAESFFPKQKILYLENGFEENVYKYRHNVTSLSQCLILQNGLPCSWLEAGVCSMPRLAQPRPACSMQHPLQPLQARAAPVPGY